MKHPATKYFLISLVIILIDQVVKMLVHTNMQMGSQGQILIVGELFKLHYLTNPGMAFGMRLDFEYGKLILTLFRIGAMFAIGYYLFSLVKKEANKGLLICISLILGGAIGNLIDSVFYGVLLDNAPFDAPTPWFHGQVVDMFIFNFGEGGPSSPIFNIADVAISVGIISILIFQNKFQARHERLSKPAVVQDDSPSLLS